MLAPLHGTRNAVHVFVEHCVGWTPCSASRHKPLFGDAVSIHVALMGQISDHGSNEHFFWMILSRAHQFGKMWQCSLHVCRVLAEPWAQPKHGEQMRFKRREPWQRGKKAQDNR